MPSFRSIIRDSIKTSRIEEIFEFLISKTSEKSSRKSSLVIQEYKNGFLNCNWIIGLKDQKKILSNKNNFLALRIYDVTNSMHISNTSASIMKEVELSKNSNQCLIPIPFKGGVFNVELGYRTKNTDWRSILTKRINFNLNLRFIPFKEYLDNWFDSPYNYIQNELTIHEKLYKLSSNTFLGGSEKVVKNMNESGSSIDVN